MTNEPVPCGTIVARAVDPDCLKRSTPAGVRKSAFIPRSNGRHHDGLSVDIVGPITLEGIRARMNAPEKEAVTLHPGHVRGIVAGSHALDVLSDPIEGNSDHALITGFPPRAPDETAQTKLIWNRLAELLALQAPCCLKQ